MSGLMNFSMGIIRSRVKRGGGKKKSADNNNNQNNMPADRGTQRFAVQRNITFGSPGLNRLRHSDLIYPEKLVFLGETSPQTFVT